MTAPRLKSILKIVPAYPFSILPHSLFFVPVSIIHSSIVNRQFQSSPGTDLGTLSAKGAFDWDRHLRVLK